MREPDSCIKCCFKPVRCNENHYEYSLILDPGFWILVVFGFHHLYIVYLESCILDPVYTIPHLPSKRNYLIHIVNDRVKLSR